MKNKKSSAANRFAGARIPAAAILLLTLLLLCVSCDKLFIPGDVPDGPSALTLSSEAGERTAEPLSYYWVKTKTDVRSEVEGPDPLSVEYDPLVVQPGEPIRFTFADDNAPWILNVAFRASDGEGGFLERVMLSQPDSGNENTENNVFVFSAPDEDGILIAEAHWPRWVNTGISAEVTYAFYVWSAKG
ncbi:MAG: hypothetical protein J6Q17_00615 [Clostridia bacterium]|nr:hypothetical protein [Clostridia bacterium]